MARQIAPHLFEKEVDPVVFLRRNDFDPWATAQRLVAYWKCRKETLGDRWLMPLALSTHYGALRQVDIDIVRSGNSIVHDEFLILDYTKFIDFAAETNYSEDDIENARSPMQFYFFTFVLE